MTVPDQTPISRSTGNGVTTVFAYGFKILAAEDLLVEVDDVALSYPADYSVSGVGVDGGGSITCTVAPANGTTVVRRLNMAFERETDYQDQGELPTQDLDDDFDRAVLLLQQLREIISRSFTLPASSSGVSTELPAPLPSAILGWNTLGTSIVNYTGAAAVPVSPYMATVLDDPDAPSARATLGALGAGLLTASGLTMNTASMLGRTAGGTGAIGEMSPSDVVTFIAPVAGSLVVGGFKNKLINGNFWVNQRGVSGTVILTAGQFGHDRWKAGASGCTYTYANSGGIVTLTISAGSLQQTIEAGSLQTQNYIMSWVGTAQGKIGAGSYSSSGVTSAVTGSTQLTVEFGTGTLSRVQLEAGTTATPFEFVPVGVDEALCQRYYYRSGHDGTNSGSGPRLAVYGVSGQYVSQVFTHPVLMRAAPTITKNGTWGATSCGQPNGRLATRSTWLMEALCSATVVVDSFTNSSDDYFEFNAEI